MQTTSKNIMFILSVRCLMGMSVSKMVNQVNYGLVRRESGDANRDTSMANDVTRITSSHEAASPLY